MSQQARDGATTEERRAVADAAMRAWPRLLLEAKSITLGATPTGIAMAPNGRHVYVSSKEFPADTVWVVSVIDTTVNEVVTTIPVDTGPGLVVTAARNVYVANTGSNTVSVIDV